MSENPNNNEKSMKTILMLSGAAVACVGAFFLFSGKKDDTNKVEEVVKPAVVEQKDSTKPEKEQAIQSPATETKVEESTISSLENSNFKADDLKQSAAIFADKSVITVGEVKQLIDQAPEKFLNEMPFAKIYKLMLLRLINSKILLESAKSSGLDKDPEFIKKVPEIKELILQKHILDREVAKLLTDDVLKSKYQELVKELPADEEFELSHVLCKTQEDAEKVLKELQASTANIETRFAQAVLQHSVDPSTKSKQGLIGWLRKEVMKNELIAQTKPGNLVPKVVKLFDQGYSVFYVKSKRPAQPPTFEQAKDELKTILNPQFAIPFVDKLRKDSGVKLTGLDAQPLALPEMPPMPKLGTNPKDMPKMPEPKDFSAVNEKALSENMVVAEFKDGAKITLQQVRDNVGSLPAELQNEPFHKLFMPVLLRLVDTTLLTQKAKAEKVEESEEFKKKLDDAEKMTLQNLFMQKKLETAITQPMLREIYNEVSVMFPKDDMEINLRHILVKTKEEAMDIIKEVKKGGATRFNELVKEKSLDEQSKEKNGEIGYLPQSELSPELATVVKKAPKATMLPEPIQLGQDGYSVIRVEDKRRREVPSFDKVLPQLMKIAQQRESAKFIKKLIEDSNIQIFDIKGSKITTESFLQK